MITTILFILFTLIFPTAIIMITVYIFDSSGYYDPFECFMTYLATCSIAAIFYIPLTGFALSTSYSSTEHAASCVVVETPTQMLVESVENDEIEPTSHIFVLKTDFDKWRDVNECVVIKNYNYFNNYISSEIKIN